jgi:diguanylate cyclase (GGDEF)-like protein
MLNRNALAGRVAELTQQSEVSAEPVGVIVADIDNFKAINDSAGHAEGDAVLQEIAYLLRKQLRAFELVYRLGGEEFLMLVPGADLDTTVELAERLREAVHKETFGDGHRVSLSFGVAASPQGEHFDYDQAFAQADAALYRAKRAGRDRVDVDGLESAPASATA